MKILLIGNSPLPEENTKSRPAAGLRTYQFWKALREKFEVKLVKIAMPECYEEIEQAENVISKNDPRLRKKVQQLHDAFEPYAVVAVNTFPSYVAAGLKSVAPMWTDLNGWIMAEGQAQAYKLDSNDYLDHYYKMERAVLRRADKISAVSQVQTNAVLGELAGLGRLNKESFGYKFVEHIPNGTEWFAGERELKEKSELFEKVPDDAFILLWMGGYNTWVDEETLFESVERAMKKCANLYFVSTGGKIAGLDNKTFDNFLKKIEASEFKKRFVFLGWVETDVIPYIYKKADAGLNVDRMCVETLTGARNRLNEMMKFGLPVVTTLGSEVSYDVEKAGAGLGVESGDVVALAEAVSLLYRKWEEKSGDFEEFGRQGEKYVREKCNYETTVAPLVKWLEKPVAAPDRGVEVNLGGMGLKAGLRYLKENGLKKTFKKLWQKLREI